MVIVGRFLTSCGLAADNPQWTFVAVAAATPRSPYRLSGTRPGSQLLQRISRRRLQNVNRAFQLGVVASSRPPTATPRESPGPAARRLCRIAFRCLSRGLADPTDFSLRADARPYGLSALGSVGADVWMAQPAGSSIRQEFRTARRAGSVLSGVRLRECRLSWVRRHRTCPRSRQGYSAEGLPRPRFRRSGREVRASPWPRLPRRAGSRG